MSCGIIALKLLLEPSEESRLTLNGQSRICNWLYNQLLDKGQKLRETFIQTQDEECAKALYTKRGLRNLIPGLKKEHPFLKTVHSSPLKNVGLRLTDAIQTHQRSKNFK